MLLSPRDRLLLDVGGIKTPVRSEIRHSATVEMHLKTTQDMFSPMRVIVLIGGEDFRATITSLIKLVDLIDWVGNVGCLLSAEICFQGSESPNNSLHFMNKRQLANTL